LEQSYKRQPYLKDFPRWLRGACMIAGVYACMSASVFAQGDTAGTATPAKKTSGTKTTSPTNHAKAASSKPNLAGDAKRRSAPHPVAKHAPSKGTGVAHGARSSKVTRASSGKNSRKATAKKVTARGQQKIDAARAQAIQEALIREHYMNGEPAGFWNQESEDAMRRYQADHGWQSKEVPDSRALISLGLGPSHDHLLNPESAMTTGPDMSHSASVNSSSPQNPVSHPVSTGDPVSAPSGQDPAGPQ
jgi:hypothetical protein